MTAESDQLLKNRLSELAKRAYSRECYTFSEFLNMAEQDVICKMVFDKNSAPFVLYGGYEAAERKIACFGDEAICGYIVNPPVSCIKISPLSQKFADELTHRDFLGALMNLGIRREVLGDIILKDNIAFLFCLDSISGYITENLSKVKHTSINCFVTESPELITELPDIKRISVASERLDAIVASVYKLSRNESRELIEEGKVFINSRLAESPSISPNPENIISVRGFGRFIYEGIERETKKGRLMIFVRIF